MSSDVKLHYEMMIRDHGTASYQYRTSGATSTEELLLINEEDVGIGNFFAFLFCISAFDISLSFSVSMATVFCSDESEVLIAFNFCIQFIFTANSKISSGSSDEIISEGFAINDNFKL